MSDASESAPSKRAMETTWGRSVGIVERVRHKMGGDYFLHPREAVEIVDAELRKEREAFVEEIIVLDGLPFNAEFCERFDALAAKARAIRAGAPPAPDRAEAGEELAKAVKNLMPYLDWQLSKESPGYAPTMPSAVAAVKTALSVYRWSQK